MSKLISKKFNVKENRIKVFLCFSLDYFVDIPHGCGPEHRQGFCFFSFCTFLVISAIQ